MTTESLASAVALPLPVWLELTASVLLVGAGLFALLGSIGLVRLRDFPMRLHAPTKASTMGVGGTLLASMLCFGWWEGRVPVQELLITAWVFLTAPVTAHLLMQAHRARHRAPTVGNDVAPRPAETPSGPTKSGGSPE